MNINRDYLIINDVKKSSITLNNGNMFFYITDKNTQNIFVNLVINVSDNDLIQKYANIENAKDYTLTMNIVKPDNDCKIIEGKLHDKEKAIFEFDLKEDCVDKVGTYKCELLTKCNINGHEEITTSNNLTYKVNSSILNDLDDIVEAPEYPVVIQLLDKLSDIEQYEEDRRANELARQLAEEQRQTRFNTLDADMVDRVNAMDDKMVDVENRVLAKEQAVDKLIVDTKADIDNYKVAKDQEIDEYKTAKDTEINNAITAQDNKIDTAISEQNDRITVVENNVVAQNNRLDIVENKNQQQDNRLDIVEAKNVEQDNRLDDIEAVNVSQGTRLDAIEIKNQQQDDRLLDVEKVNKRQDMDLKCLFTESKNNMIDVTEEGNSIYLQNSTTGYALVDEIQGQTLVNCNKEPDKELILMGEINAKGTSNITLTEGVNGGLVDVALEGNTMVNVCNQKDPIAITKSYTVETGNHVALQGEYDGKCRPVVTGNTLVNLFSNTNTLTYDTRIVTPCLDKKDLFKPGVYTAINNTGRKIVYAIYSKDTVSWIKEYVSDSNIALTLGDNEYIYTYQGLFLDGWSANDVELFKKSCIILEGDYTNKPIPEYFEGLQSSFEDKVVTQEMVDAGEELAENLGKYRVEYKVTGKNKSNLNNRKFIDSTKISVDNNTVTHKGNGYADIQFWVYLYKNITYTLSYNSDTGQECDILKGKQNEYVESELIVKSSNGGTFAVNSTGWYSLHFAWNISGGNESTVSNIQLEEGTEATTYEPYKEYKKTLYLNSPLLEGDTIEQQGDNVVHVHRYGRVVLDGSENAWKISGIAKTNTIGFYLSDNSIKTGPKGTYLCDKFKSLSFADWNAGVDDEFIVDGTGFISISIAKSKLSSNNSEGFKQWLHANPTTVVYKLATPQYEVISQNDTILCDSYVNGHLDVDSVVPIDQIRFVGVGSVLKYLYPSTEYIIQFEPDNIGKLDYIGLNWRTYAVGESIVKGINKFRVTIDNTINSDFFEISGIGFNASNIVVTQATDQEFGYFEGMKSVGECEDLEVVSSNSDSTLSNTQTLTHEPLRAVGDIKDKYVLIDGKWYIERNCGVRAYQEGDIDNYITDKINTVYPLATPTYEPINYNPFEVYSDTTHITNNSTIPCNMIIKNTGYNCLLKPSTTYTISSNLGLNTVTTPSTLTEDCLRFYDTDTSTITTMNNVTILEGDYTTGKPIPSHFSGIESCFEQEYDEEKGKYKVKVRVQNEDKTQENNITFYINEPLRGIGDVKDKVYVKDDKVVVERNCGSAVFDGSEDEEWDNNGILTCNDFMVDWSGTHINCICNTLLSVTYVQSNNQFKDKPCFTSHGGHFIIAYVNNFKQWLQQNPTTVVYQLASPTYEEVEYNDVKLFIESFKNSTLFYNSNIPVTSKVWYSYSVPIVDTVAQTADISDQQDSMIIDLATQVSVMEMMLM